MWWTKLVTGLVGIFSGAARAKLRQAREDRKAAIKAAAKARLDADEKRMDLVAARVAEETARDRARKALQKIKELDDESPTMPEIPSANK